jgi:Tol biopolymer transport system component
MQIWRMHADGTEQEQVFNVPSWSPDSKRLAFVSYGLIPEENIKRKTVIQNLRSNIFQ